jgi:signal transduction histidine kinase
VLEGYATVNARSRSEKFGWTAAVAVPQSLLFHQFFGPAALAALAGFIVSLLALAALGLLASRLVQDVRTLAKATETLSGREFVDAAPMSIKELNIVARGIEHASERLQAEEQFRKRAVDELAHRLRNKVACVAIRSCAITYRIG